MTYGIPPDPDQRPRRTVVGALVAAAVTLAGILLIVWAFGLLAGDGNAEDPQPAPQGAVVLRVDTPWERA